MLLDVCVVRPSGAAVGQWDFVLTNFSPASLHVIGDGPVSQTFDRDLSAVYVLSAEDLPEGPLIVFAPADGRYVQGAVSLADHEFDPQATYLFGADHVPLSEDHLGSRMPDETVFVPTDSHDEMFSHVAYAVAAWEARRG